MTTIVAYEWRYLRAAAVVVAGLLMLELAGWLVYREVHVETPPLELTTRCLTREKLLDVSPIRDDPIAASANHGALATRVEGNGVHVAIAGSVSEAERLVENYRSIAGELLTGRLERRGKVVYLWEGGATQTARQTMYDCFYD
jgi:hypothetical protein